MDPLNELKYLIPPKLFSNSQSAPNKYPLLLPLLSVRYSHDKGNHSLDWACHSILHISMVHMALTTTKMFFQGGKTTDNHGGGERGVRNDPHEDRRTVGFIGKLSCNQHND